MAIRTQNDRQGTSRRGEEIYERDIKPTLDDSKHGHYVSIDVDTGCWTIAETRRASIDELYERWPDARNVWMLRVGHRTLINLGGHRVRVEKTRLEPIGNQRQAGPAKLERGR